MKSYATFFVIALMSLGLVFLLATRERTKHDAPAEVVEVKPEATDAGAEGGVATGTGGDAAARPAPAADAAPPGPTEKPLLVVTLGWEIAAPTAAITPPGGGPPPAPAPRFEIAPESALTELEARLARGGADPDGADVAILPLPAFVAAFDKLRALEPKIFLVPGFSHGREAIHSAAGALLKPPPGADEVKLVALAPATAAQNAAGAPVSESATVLGLFALDLLGVSPTRLHLVPHSPEAKSAPFAAILRGAADERKLAFSTADASHLVPIVAVAPKAVLDTKEATVREWAKAWLDGLGKVGKDVPAIARRLASKDALPLVGSAGGAPEALVLVERLGQIENLTAGRQAAFLGPLAKEPVTLETLTAKTWQLARGGGLTTNAAPEPLPIDARIVSALGPPDPPKEAPAAAGADGGVAFGPVPAGATPLVVYRATEGDADKVATQVAFLAGVFERAVFRIGAKGGEKAAKSIAAAVQAKGVAPSRLAVAAADPGILASVEILSPP